MEMRGVGSPHSSYLPFKFSTFVTLTVLVYSRFVPLRFQIGAINSIKNTGKEKNRGKWRLFFSCNLSVSRQRAENTILA